MLALQTCPEYLQFYKDFQSSKPTEEIVVGGLRLMVFRDVYSPDPSVSHGSQMMLNHLGQLQDQRVLDLGTGCGLFAIRAALDGAKAVTAVDMNHLSIVNTMENVQRFDLEEKVELIPGDLFNALDSTHAPFDLILAHLPTLEEEVCFNPSLLDLYYDLTLNAAYYLNDKGRMLVSYPAFGDLKVLYFLERHPLMHQSYKERRFGVDWILFEFRAPGAHKLRHSMHP